MRIDTHVHSNHSDGRSSVRQIFSLAKRVNLDVIALTDHDTNSGWQQAQYYSKINSIGFIPGSEISTSYQGKIFHLLAYLYDENDSVLQNLYSKSKKLRFLRFMQMFEKVEKDFDIRIKDLFPQDYFGDKTLKELKDLQLPLGRPHLADAIIKRGYCKNRDECFSTILHPCEKYYVPYIPTDINEVVKIVVNAGGGPVLAHAFSQKRGKTIDEKTLLSLKKLGLLGVEINHREHNVTDRQKAYDLSKKLGLLQFGASDYHGSGKPNHLGENLTAYETILELEKHTFRKVEWNGHKSNS